MIYRSVKQSIRQPRLHRNKQLNKQDINKAENLYTYKDKCLGCMRSASYWCYRDGSCVDFNSHVQFTSSSPSPFPSFSCSFPSLLASFSSSSHCRHPPTPGISCMLFTLRLCSEDQRGQHEAKTRPRPTTPSITLSNSVTSQH